LRWRSFWNIFQETEPRLGGKMGLSRIDASFLFISAFVSFIATVAIVLMVDWIQPGLMESRAGTSVFVFIGVFSANLLIEAWRRRIERSRSGPRRP
jgi:hypothetical protein